MKNVTYICSKQTICSLLENSPTNHIFLKTFSSEVQEIKVWFTDQTSKPLEVEDKIELTLIIKYYGYYKNALFNWA